MPEWRLLLATQKKGRRATNSLWCLQRLDPQAQTSFAAAGPFGEHAVRWQSAPVVPRLGNITLRLH
jgi:hypothetical protein